MASWEEARKCPKCSLSGKEGTTRRIPGSRDRLVGLTCENPRCKWYTTSWVVQVHPDGSVVEPDTRPREKAFPASPSGLVIATSMESLERELNASMQPGAEIRRRA